MGIHLSGKLLQGWEDKQKSWFDDLKINFTVLDNFFDYMVKLDMKINPSKMWSTLLTNRLWFWKVIVFVVEDDSILN